jgi:hypothetical protein
MALQPAKGVAQRCLNVESEASMARQTHPNSTRHRQGDHAMTKAGDTGALLLRSCVDGRDAIEARLRANIRGTIAAVCNEVG